MFALQGSTLKAHPWPLEVKPEMGEDLEDG